MGVSKNTGKTPKMDGENHGSKPYEQMDDLEGFSHYFLETSHLDLPKILFPRKLAYVLGSKLPLFSYGRYGHQPIYGSFHDFATFGIFASAVFFQVELRGFATNEAMEARWNVWQGWDGLLGRLG